MSQPKFPHNLFLFFLVFALSSWYPVRSMSRMWAEFWLLRVLCCDVFLLSFGLCVAFLVLLQTLHGCTQPFHAVSSLCTTPPPSPPLRKKRGVDFQGVVTSHGFNEWILDPLATSCDLATPCDQTEGLCFATLLCSAYSTEFLSSQQRLTEGHVILNNTRPSAMRNPREPNYHSSGQMKLFKTVTSGTQTTIFLHVAKRPDKGGLRNLAEICPIFQITPVPRSASEVENPLEKTSQPSLVEDPHEPSLYFGLYWVGVSKTNSTPFTLLHPLHKV